MAQTRYDDKGRSLLPNEYQKEDGRYEYRYIDLNGVRRSVYSWKLKRSDQTVGKNQDEICLRDIEKQLSRDKQDGIDTYTAKRMSLNSLFDDYIQDRPLKTYTRTNYKYMYNKYIRETLGVRNIADIHYSGVREIPMFDEVRQALLQEKSRQQKEGENNTIIDGYCGFIFTNRFGGVYSAHCVNRAISRIIADYNQAEVELAQIENRSPALLPHFSVHHLRHTFCSRMCENTSDSNTLKVIQESMGHADISTTLDVYTDLTRKKKQNAFAGLQGKFRLR